MTEEVKNSEQMYLVLGYYFDGAIQETFLHFESAERLDAAAGLTEKISTNWKVMV